MLDLLRRSRSQLRHIRYQRGQEDTNEARSPPEQRTDLPSRGEDFRVFALSRENRGISDSDARGEKLAPWAQRIPQCSPPKRKKAKSWHALFHPSRLPAPLPAPLPALPAPLPARFPRSRRVPRAIRARMPFRIAPRFLQEPQDPPRSVRVPPRTPPRGVRTLSRPPQDPSRTPPRPPKTPPGGILGASWGDWGV